MTAKREGEVAIPKKKVSNSNECTVQYFVSINFTAAISISYFSTSSTLGFHLFYFHHN